MFLSCFQLEKLQNTFGDVFRLQVKLERNEKKRSGTVFPFEASYSNNVRGTRKNGFFDPLSEYKVYDQDM